MFIVNIYSLHAVDPLHFLQQVTSLDSPHPLNFQQFQWGFMETFGKLVSGTDLLSFLDFNPGTIRDRIQAGPLMFGDYLLSPACSGSS